MKGWATVGEVAAMSRLEVLEQNEWLDALEEAEDEARRKAEAEAKARAAPKT